MRVIIITSVVVATVAPSAPLAGNWPQWRGEARDGAAVTLKLPAAWPAKLTRVWSREVGIGHSSPIVVATRVFQHARQGQGEKEEEIVRGDVVIYSGLDKGITTMRVARRVHGDREVRRRDESDMGPSRAGGCRDSR